MPISTESINKEVYDVLRSRGFDPIPLDSKGRHDIDIENADVFRFEFIDDNEEKIDKAWVTVEGKELVFYVGDKLTDDDDFLKFLKFIKRWSQRKLLGFTITNKDHLHSDMKKRTTMKKKKLGEGYYPLNKKASYSDNVPQVKIIIQHTRQIQEGEQRFRNVEKIYVENAGGERFLLPTNRPGLARVYARHIAEGGTPYDDKGKHITSLVEEYTKMAGFVRATKNGQFNENAQKLVSAGLDHYQSLRETLSRMATTRGYNKYFENYTPVLNEETTETNNINELFVQETLDPRIENVVPILQRLHKNIVEMAEVNELNEWASQIIETELEEEVRVKYEVVKNGRRIGTWDGITFVPYDRTQFPAGKMDMIPAGSKVDKESGPLTSGKEGLGKIGLEEIRHDDDALTKATATVTKQERDEERNQFTSKDMEDWYKMLRPLAGLVSEEQDDDKTKERPYVCVHAKKGKYECKASSSYEAVKKAAQHWKLKSTAGIDAHLADVTHTPINEKTVEEDLDANQKRAGQLGPKQKVGPKGAVGKLVGANENADLSRLKNLSGLK